MNDRTAMAVMLTILTLCLLFALFGCSKTPVIRYIPPEQQQVDK